MEYTYKERCCLPDFLYVVKLLYVKDRRNSLLYFITNLLSAPILFAELFTTKYVVDLIQNFNPNTYQHILLLVSLLMVMLYLAGLNSSLRAIAITNLTSTSIYELEHSILEKTSKLSTALLEDPATKTKREKAKRLSLIDLLDQWTGVTVHLITLVALMVVLSVYGFYILALIILGVQILQLYLMKRMSQKVESISANQTSSVRMINYLVDLLINRNSIPEVRMYRMSSYLFSSMKESFTNNFKQMHRKVIYSETHNFSQSLIMILLNGTTIAILAITIGSSGQSAGLFVLLLQISSQLFIVIPALTRVYADLAKSRLRYEDYTSYLDLEEQVLRDQEVNSNKNTDPMKVQVHQLFFRYPTNAKNTLSNINMTIHPGERIAFVGENGSGKSTLVKLILGLYPATAGNIQWFKGENEVLAHNVTQDTRVVFQDFIKLQRPIRENIALGNMATIHDDSRLLAAMRTAEADNYGVRLDTLVGPQFGGIDLSGGQWQRLAIARAYLKDGALMIFDEPTAALDPYAEQQAFDTFMKLGEQRTSIIVTHRLYMSKFVDKIFLFEDGEIVESGTHEELMRVDGKYKKMFNRQSSLYV
ncbi:ABC transporter ATP-binding protein [Paenibacillus sp. B2(2019)]|nr:ABC transporter ATP-binding protein [Paenibacillus sp. B2(2019)]